MASMLRSAAEQVSSTLGGNKTGTTQLPPIVQTYTQAVNSGDWNTLQSLFAQNAVVYNGRFDGNKLTGIDQILQMYKDVRLSFPNFSVAPEYASVDSTGRQLFVRSSWSGTNQGTLWFGAPATNRQVKMYDFVQLQLDSNGRIEKAWVYCDRASLLQQLGLVDLSQFSGCASCQQGQQQGVCTHAPGSTGAFPPQTGGVGQQGQQGQQGQFVGQTRMM